MLSAKEVKAQDIKILNKLKIDTMVSKLQLAIFITISAMILTIPYGIGAKQCNTAVPGQDRTNNKPA